ncbi:hypothetical protein PAAG_01533 [Paracoccidioides lutzii Pb01]|uniref:Piwi domain-containing protein n=1 Tax=Paracoccidioides lutzii (strain ATCC MYA-826 / Pb01) TaxID=502779 RepID=C1GSN8_PARBA|nr:hypothetical protein PAAG_01533 [Paracoccidioides lutzii Pb01]EEH39071.1 hypothetical protein PAAG_01533 [Paracoccidioides lutzii Pb01]
MVVATDVTHPSPGSASNTPSIAGIIASINSQLAQWPADLRIQTYRQEMVSALDDLLETRLKLWAKHHQQNYPENILVVLNNELPLLQKASASLYSATDIKIRLPAHKASSLSASDIIPATQTTPSTRENGAVVDRGVTDVRNWDFLESHTALQGTARPGHYYIVDDEVRSTAAASAMSSVVLALVEMSQMPSKR